MRDLVRSAFIIGAAALFAGCAGSQEIGETASPQMQERASFDCAPPALRSGRQIISASVFVRNRLNLN
jgi:hypothetical protein